MSNIDQELNSQLSAWTIQCVIHHDESFVDPLCYLRRLNSGQPGERCLIPPIEPRQPGGCKLKTAPVRPVVAARPAEYVCSEDLFY
ncbi:transposase (plasmid) [Escherichia coli]|uniref:Uncharacterized protein n=2 Tax=Escherichia coli TaxID=562 RepID=A0A1B1LNN4_ECOLX|nr:hypothetical protein [Escherichia coli]MCH6876612.1 hypothetical protein [Escherichia coli]BBF63084.1 transposase [Escherichia coli]